MLESNNVGSGLSEFDTEVGVVVETLLFVFVNDLVHSFTGTLVKGCLPKVVSASVPIATTNLLLDSVIEAESIGTIIAQASPQPLSFPPSPTQPAFEP